MLYSDNDMCFTPSFNSQNAIFCSIRERVGGGKEEFEQIAWVTSSFTFVVRCHVT